MQKILARDGDLMDDTIMMAQSCKITIDLDEKLYLERFSKLSLVSKC